MTAPFGPDLESAKSSISPLLAVWFIGPLIIPTLQLRLLGISSTHDESGPGDSGLTFRGISSHQVTCSMAQHYVWLESSQAVLSRQLYKLLRGQPLVCVVGERMPINADQHFEYSSAITAAPVPFHHSRDLEELSEREISGSRSRLPK
ncbi:hypothetical protein C8F04DRAFT_1234033 [Mycena alexandri]|uniref:Uncharacterized protein n=1 Tax=Mycena alexandri TaxID=1745969 RepID=A0AAD6SYY4_9AGAR|nr:hypothetical protein C8F04DRAFT_1234033 [Mycena alexandri]